ncbi:uncharacterized protein [Nicotiana sylvestris]|uniref:Uncharacterized protein LOC104212322 n=1 Tax=Nicotiana sylvestris TaxID=4096 RepID=A0A1U7V0B2_NICSY|nr:PREDICTED: uncharacterized protein LOC104212322 [Nicotiana sylvestris]
MKNRERILEKSNALFSAVQNEQEEASTHEVLTNWGYLLHPNFIFFLKEVVSFFSSSVFTMSNLSKLEFMALDISGNNYLSWVFDAEIYLDAKSLGDIIKEGNEASSQDKTKAMIFLRHHLDEGLKSEYLTLKDPFQLWTSLKKRYDHLKATVLPRARREWMHLRLQDYKTINEYNSVVYRIIFQLKLCGEPMNDENMLKKTLFTFHASNMVLQQQYREKGFKKYSELISCILVIEQHNALLIKNHEVRPTGSALFPEANLGMIDPKSGKR